MSHWDFTDLEIRSMMDAYDAITRVGNKTRDERRHGAESDHWDPILDRAHHDLGLLVSKVALQNNGLPARPR